MGLLDALILGLVQGLTEFLPISSSAHLRIVSELLPGLGGRDTGAAFTAITQLGTETAVIIYFWRDIVRIVSGWARSLVGRVPRTDPDARMGWLIILGSLPIIVLGLVFQDAIETTLRSLWVVATTLILFGVLLGIADAVGAKKRRLRDLGVRDGLIYGGAQALALIPGVSRSGGTITAGLFLGYERKAAARYSFLLAIPAVFGSGLYQLYKSISDPEVLPNQVQVGGLETLVATIVAFVVGFVVIAFFMNYISRRSFLPFVVYRIVLGVVLMVALGTGLIAA
ncbi:undecaprenyl-diphosphate phosphatase [Rathayibacter rathayi]|uniref:Undecaprenyl-diphosphatase n=1 Tax=Rathayibacter rathayi TaxID=33887 RepID=A0ABD6W6I8_RATRA|nr:undecaprenyl-diphosphate phosphatase [Rathayibacter rathayi]AZZ48773.1 undecaprenyl-diphosphate phosphatase [Rathayibacter rathayi]MWV73858.1 undecaprenyl-diphosphate phosphatase [Rathayibacter rathayi NCPPB 2980 = VKM Ac-1601]PPF11313.1 undecaprenyl-diphosphate phosphatase [Rathayibacter rathayi]PPF25380.1 undecaprenyl-diphosphate phosphatase [Rathayibacter rathayi]PPF50783.1 undecaprenyl-diphosphate phosphatase [Rathayibacter rathayi]